MISEVHELSHVDLLDVREMGRRDVRLGHLLEDPLPEPMDRNSLFGAARGHRHGGRRCDDRRPRGAFRGIADVILREASLRTTPPDGSQVDIQFFREATYGGW